MTISHLSLQAELLHRDNHPWKFFWGLIFVKSIFFANSWGTPTRSKEEIEGWLVWVFM
jgi:hypothetical protein